MKHLLIHNLQFNASGNALTRGGQLCSDAQLFLIQREKQFI